MEPEEPQDLAQLRAMMQAGMPGGCRLLRFESEAGGERWYRCSFTLVAPPDGVPEYALMPAEDLAQLRQTCLQDPLTGVLNRRGIVQALDRLFSADPSARHALVMVDIDRFKALNDRMGHPYGDSALCAVVEALRGCLRSGDLIGRLGGDEFILCLTDLPPGYLPEERLERICAALLLKLPQGVESSCCLGAAIYPDDGTDFDLLYPKADCALYTAKRRGAGRCALYGRAEKNQATELP